MASIRVSRNSPRQAIEPSAIYGDASSIRLHIATGGAGGTGLLKALAEAFIKTTAKDYTASQVNSNEVPFGIAWVSTDTSLSFNALASGAADVSIVYHPYAVKLALQQGIATRTAYAWRDHFMLVGPSSNPADLPTSGTESIQSLFSRIFLAAVSSQSSPNPVRFLSRYDRSANNIRESHFWSSIGQTPWSEPYSTWYHKFVDFPIGALRAAAKLGEYTLVDRGTWYAVGDDVKGGLSVYQEVFDAAEDDPLLNPAHVLVGHRARDKTLAEDFVEWLLKKDGGQDVVGKFAINGVVLHSPAPEGVTGFEQWDYGKTRNHQQANS